ncbi:MAG TPA: hypothetical protein DCS28_02865 [Candidatus Moranbacteria bacterium]|nr:hypothetical protein [Candidatus Moranbacteria bacterium]HAT74958.1 hypothetical protein [Candidatus Moranbacteria bacterium]
MPKLNNKIIVILGPTSSGKSSVAIKLAQKLNGEIISADSRQIYRGMDIGTGKIKPDQPGEIPQDFADQGKIYAGSIPFISEGIIHHMLNIVSPKTNFSAAQFKKKADKIIKDASGRGKLPIICGGTGFWIKAIVDNVIYPEVKPDWKLREKLEKKSAEELFAMLKKMDSRRAKNIDAKNKIRLIRAIEICKTLGKVPIPLAPSLCKPAHLWRGEGWGEVDFLQIGIDIPKEKLHKNIKKRLKQRFSQGMIEEIEILRKKYKLSWKKIQNFGLSYGLIPQYLKGEIKSEKELFEKIFQAEKDYAKRQMTWFKKDKRIIWLKNYIEIKREVLDFLAQ